MTPPPTATDWATRAVPVAMSEEKLASFVDRALDGVDGMLFTATPREELEEIGRWQQLKDQAFAGQLRAIVAAYNRASSDDRFFAGDEVGLAIGAASTTGGNLVVLALKVAALPGLLEAVSAGILTERHVHAVLRELDAVTLTWEQRQAVVLVMLARYDCQTPGELGKLIARLILTVDRAAAQSRQDVASSGRRIRCYPDADGQAVLHARGPIAKIAAIKASLEATLPLAADAGDERSTDQREFDLFVELLTGSQTPHGGQAQVIVPFHTAAGGELELAEIPGFGPILPSTAHDLLQGCASLVQVAVDEDGQVLAVSDPHPATAAPAAQPAPADPPTADQAPTDPAADTAVGPSEGPADRTTQLVEGVIGPVGPVEDFLLTALKAMSVGPQLRGLSTSSYRIPKRLTRFLEARDRTCVFPGCRRPAAQTDKDHRIPWPRGLTDAANLQCLCRHHHRAKQAVFTVELTTDGDYRWTTRGGWQFPRRHQGYYPPHRSAAHRTTLRPRTAPAVRDSGMSGLRRRGRYRRRPSARGRCSHDEGQQMTDSTAPADTTATAAKPTGLKAMASDVGLKVYLKAPPPAQNAMLQGFTRAQPVVAKVSPHAKKILGGGLAVLVLRKLRHRGRKASPTTV